MPVYLQHLFGGFRRSYWAFLVDQSKESTCNAGATGDSSVLTGLEDPLGEGMATHSRILAWRIPWTEKPGRLQSIGLQ